MRYFLKDKHPLLKILFFILLSLVSLFLIMFLGVVIGYAIWGGSFLQVVSSMNIGENIVPLKYLQLLSHLGMFIVPALAFGFFVEKNGFKYLTLNKGFSFYSFILVVLIMFLVQPLITWIAELNMAMNLPESLKNIEIWMQNSENQAKEITALFMKTDTVNGLLLNLFVVAIIPAIGEELVFRGILQKCLHEWIKSAWIAVLVTAIIFSAFHLQFYGFFPRLLLGIVLGLVFAVSNKLWLSIVMHFVNNGTAVVLYWLYARKQIEFDPETAGSLNEQPILLIASVIIFLLLIFVFIKRQKNEQREAI